MMRSIGLFIQFSFMSISFSLILTACMVGPDFHSPSKPNTTSYNGVPLLNNTVSSAKAGKNGRSQYFYQGQDIPTQWWYLYHSHELNKLVKKGMSNSPNLAAAVAALHHAQQNYISQFATSFIPSITLNSSAQRQRFNFNQFGNTGAAANVFNLLNVTPKVNYTLDLFGGGRRLAESLRAQVEYAGFQLEAAHLALTSNIVTTAITAAAYREQIKAIKEMIRLQRGQLKVIRAQFNLGAISKTTMLTQESQLALTQARLPALEQSLSQSLHMLSILVGDLPDENELPVITLNQLTLPIHLPVSLPSMLARQRPDVRASEALLASASAQVGVATANMYPQITLTGQFGWNNESIGGLFGPTNVVWNVTGSLLQSLFDAGALHAKRDAAVAVFEQAAAQYRQTVLQAFQNVADTLSALEHDAQILQAQTAAEVAARSSLMITQKQFKLGSVNYLSLLTAQNTYQQAKLGQIQAVAARYNDTAALFQALGGGWWHRCCNAKLNLSEK